MNWNNRVFMGSYGSDESWRPEQICKAVGERRAFWMRDDETWDQEVHQPRLYVQEKNN